MSATFDELEKLMDRLREPGGCPWDQKHDFDSYVECLKEELDEVIVAMGKRDAENLKEEIGDMLFNLIFVARLAKEEGWFTIEDSLVHVRDKIIRRHPHVFGDAKAETAEEALAHWNRMKAKEKE